MRVVSLVPSVTETLIGWGVVPAAVTRFCGRPELLTIGGTKDPDVAAIVKLAPDLVVVNDEENRADDAAALEAAGLTLHVTRVRSVADVVPALDALARAVGVTAPAAPSPPAAPEARMRAAAPEARIRAAAPEARIRAFVPIWRRPWMTLNADTYGSSLLAAAGVANVYAGAAERYPTVSLDDAASRAPDVVLAPSEPYPFRARHVAELDRVAPVELVDGEDLFWWGARTPRARARLRTRLGTLALTSFVVASLALAGCGGERPVAVRGAGPVTSLQVEVRPMPGATARRATLTCDGSPTATGFIADSRAACDLVTGDAKARARLVAGPPASQVCTQLYGGPQEAQVSGRVVGRPVDVTVTRVDGCGVADWTLLEPLLGSPG